MTAYYMRKYSVLAVCDYASTGGGSDFGMCEYI